MSQGTERLMEWLGKERTKKRGKVVKAKIYRDWKKW